MTIQSNAKHKNKKPVALKARETTKKCPQCHRLVNISILSLVTHFKMVHERNPSGDELRQFKSPAKRKRKRTAAAGINPELKKENKKQNIKRKIYVDFSIFTKRDDSALTPTQIEARERINRRGFQEGASVPGSHIRKIDK